MLNAGQALALSELRLVGLRAVGALVRRCRSECVPLIAISPAADSHSTHFTR